VLPAKFRPVSALTLGLREEFAKNEKKNTGLHWGKVQIMKKGLGNEARIETIP